MRINRSSIGYATSLLASIVGPTMLYRNSSGLSLWLLATAILTFGLVLGLAIGRFSGRVASVPIAAWALCGIALLWAPVVVVSLGSALSAFPVLLAYAALVALGANLGTRLVRVALAK